MGGKGEMAAALTFSRAGLQAGRGGARWGGCCASALSASCQSQQQQPAPSSNFGGARVVLAGSRPVERRRGEGRLRQSAAATARTRACRCSSVSSAVLPTSRRRAVLPCTLRKATATTTRKAKRCGGSTGGGRRRPKGQRFSSFVLRTLSGQTAERRLARRRRAAAADVGRQTR
jgi:hypothetical protein